MITTNYFTGLIGMKNRKVVDSSIYSEIPHFIDHDIKELAVEIYRTATKNKTFRNTSKKSIVMACVHRASSLLGDSTAISYFDLLQMFNLKQHEANKGFTILSSNIPKESDFFQKFNHEREELIGINSKMKLVEINANPQLFRLVANVFNLLKQKSNIVNSSQYSSVICGCIYFWSIFLEMNKSEDFFATSSKVSKTTLLKIYTSICDVVFNYVLKELFSKLLKNCCRVPITTGKGAIKFPNDFKKKYKNVEPEEMIFGLQEKCFVFHPFDHEKIEAVISNNKLPLENVGETLEWNLILSKDYYTTNFKFPLMVTLIKINDKNMFFDFSKYDLFNNTSGKKILNDVLLKNFDKSIQMKNN
jgi:hypothetical protein